MNIDMTDYLSDGEMKKIVEEEFRYRVKQVFNTESNITRIISNLGYYNTFKILDEEIPNFEELIKEQTKKQCKAIDSYLVFRKKDEYEKENSLAQKYLNEAVEENKDIINNKVREILNSLKEQDIANELYSVIEDKIENLFKGSENK